jgi:hypothetical protein
MVFIEGLVGLVKTGLSPERNPSVFLGFLARITLCGVTFVENHPDQAQVAKIPAKPTRSAAWFQINLYLIFRNNTRQGVRMEPLSRWNFRCGASTTGVTTAPPAIQFSSRISIIANNNHPRKSTNR